MKTAMQTTLMQKSLKTIASAMLSTMLLVGSALVLPLAHAEAINQSALNKTQYATVSVAQAKGLKDDSKVLIKGQLVKSLGDEKYEFKDSTGTMIVDIDNDKWNGKAVNANTRVTLLGEIDVDHFPKKTIELDVDEVRF